MVEISEEELARLKGVESAMIKLLRNHFSGSNLEWDYNTSQGIGLFDIDPSLYIKIHSLLPELVLK